LVRLLRESALQAGDFRVEYDLVDPVIHAALPFDQVVEADKLMEARRMMGELCSGWGSAGMVPKANRRDKRGLPWGAKGSDHLPGRNDKEASSSRLGPCLISAQTQLWTLI
jgi:hypothetical protein